MAWTTPRTWLAGEDPAASVYNAHIRDNFKAIGDPWTSYTPVLTTSGTAPSLGNGTLTGTYSAAGKRIAFKVKLVVGSTTSLGTGELRFTFPVTALTGETGGVTGYVSRSGPAYWGLLAVGFAVDRLRMISGNSLVTGTFPTTLTTSDILVVGGTYEAA